ncbi:MAG: hypothetical protein HQL32_10440 [Planctomycetes bacterium]|nr:hypothetical protein [Planctomycetota bacterium]
MDFIDSKVFSKFLEPIKYLFSSNSYRRNCPKLDDESWAKVCILRTLDATDSGRSFLTQLAINGEDYLSCSHFFESLKSLRRLNFCLELNASLVREHRDHNQDSDPFACLPELDGYNIYAGDGHSHEAPVHEEKIGKKAYATQHFYALNLRNYLLTHLELAKYGGTRKKEHDMHALKRMTITQLKQGSKKGVNNLYVWDRAGIDFLQWQKWKNQGGIYFGLVPNFGRQLPI